MDWLDLFAVQGTLKSLLQHHISKASVLWCSAFFMVQLSHPHMTTGKTIALTMALLAKCRQIILGQGDGRHCSAELSSWGHLSSQHQSWSCVWVVYTLPSSYMPLLLPLAFPHYVYFPNQSFLGVRVREPPENLMEAPECTHNSTSCTFSVTDHPAPWTVAHQAHLSMEFSRQEYWSG